VIVTGASDSKLSTKHVQRNAPGQWAVDNHSRHCTTHTHNNRTINESRKRKCIWLHHSAQRL